MYFARKQGRLAEPQMCSRLNLSADQDRLARVAREIDEDSRMGEWLQEWADVLSAFGTILMMLAWVFYAQFAIVSYFSQRRARVVIDQTEDRTLNTRFVVVNLSEQPVYISCVMVVVHSGGDEQATRIDTYSHFLSEDESASSHQLQAELRHGTLQPADLLMLGGSDRLLSWLLESKDEDQDVPPRGERLRQALSEIDYFEVRVIAMAGNEDKPIASRRRFLIEEREEEVTIYPAYAQTQHFNSWSNRRTADEWSKYCLRK